MPDFRQRSAELEMLDTPGQFSTGVLSQTYREINFINKYLLGDYFLQKDIISLLSDYPSKTLTLLDLGCGNGNLLRKLQLALKSLGFRVIGVGFDPYLDSIGDKYESEDLHLYSDWQQLVARHSIDIAVTSLTLHHLYDEVLAEALNRLMITPRYGFVISDLVRSPIAYYLIKGMTAAFSRSALVKNDAPLSVCRGFSRAEIKAMTQAAEPGTHIRVHQNIAFRWHIIGRKSV